MSNQNKNIDIFVTSGTLYKAFFPVGEISDYSPNTDFDVYAISEGEALEYLLNVEDFSQQFHSNVIYEIPRTLQRAIEKNNRKRLHIQQRLRTGDIRVIRDIKLIFMEITIDSEDMKLLERELRNGQSDQKYIRLSLKDTRFTITTKDKFILEFVEVL